jgi:phosphate transport system substrate-binding protein
MRSRIAVVLAAALVLGVCIGTAVPVFAGQTISLNGAGATFPYPLYSKWVYEFNKIHPDIQINYQSIGSGGGMRQISEGTVDFAGSDACMADSTMAKLPGKLLHIPTTMGAVVLTYNLPGAPAGLKLTQEAVSGIFLGKITKWNDPALSAQNPDAKLPDLPIQVVHRSDGSGTSAVFTGYLAAVSPDWKTKVGAGTSVSWPAGLGAKGNEGVTGQVKSTPGAIGYVELAYAQQNKLPYASVRNKSGNFVAPALESVSAAAAGVTIPEDFRVSIVDAAGEKAYPISSFTWILLYQEQKDQVRGQALADFLWWALHDGQQYAAPLSYARLPEGLVTKVEVALSKVQAGGKPALGK